MFTGMKEILISDSDVYMELSSDGKRSFVAGFSENK
jgi:hypothetical protein